eukprot:scaffold5464_cov108-Isochrysis_galbana.AAC.1
MCSTRPSRVVPHRSTTRARRGLTSLFGWEAKCPTTTPKKEGPAIISLAEVSSLTRNPTSKSPPKGGRWRVAWLRRCKVQGARLVTRKHREREAAQNVQRGREKQAEQNVQHPAFPRGPPPQYYPGSTRLNFAVRMGSGDFRVIWPHMETTAPKKEGPAIISLADVSSLPRNPTSKSPPKGGRVL